MKKLNPEIKSWKRYVGKQATSHNGRVGTIEGVKTASGVKVFYGKGTDGRKWQSRSPRLVS